MGLAIASISRGGGSASSFFLVGGDKRTQKKDIERAVALEPGKGELPDVRGPYPRRDEPDRDVPLDALDPDPGREEGL